MKLDQNQKVYIATALQRMATLVHAQHEPRTPGEDSSVLMLNGVYMPVSPDTLNTLAANIFNERMPKEEPQFTIEPEHALLCMEALCKTEYPGLKQASIYIKALEDMLVNLGIAKRP